jgi:hypothetical protein
VPISTHHLQRVPSSQTGNSAKRVFVVHSSPGNRCRSKPPDILTGRTAKVRAKPDRYA